MEKPEELTLIRTSERTTFTRCRQKWWWSYVEGLTPLEVAPALRFGDLVHQSLAAWYKPGAKRGRKPWLTFKKLYTAQLEEMEQFGMYTDEGEWTDAMLLGDAMLRNYVEFYGDDKLIEVIYPEKEFQVDLADPQTDEYICTYVGTFDAIIRDLKTGKIGLFEHKTAKAISLAHLQLDEQAGSYWAFGTDWLRSQGILGKRESLDFILYNFLRKAKPDARPQDREGRYLNQNGTVSKIQPAPYFVRQIVYRTDNDRRSTMLRIIEQAKEMEACRNGEMAIYKTPTRDCAWDCPFGPRSGMCELHEMGSDWEDVRDSVFTYWDPYEHHEGVYEPE